MCEIISSPVLNVDFPVPAQVYMLSWLERQVAATLFATPPTASLDDALKHFLQVHVPFYILNQKLSIYWYCNCIKHICTVIYTNNGV